jgi:hypothetical protein
MAGDAASIITPRDLVVRRGGPPTTVIRPVGLYRAATEEEVRAAR